MYQAVVSKVKTRPHPDPKVTRIQLGEVCGETVVIGLDVKDGDLLLYFPCDGQLSPGFAAANNLYSHSDLNWDKTKKGYFDDNRRVRAQKFRGEKSDGFAVEIDALFNLSQHMDYQAMDTEAGWPLRTAIHDLKDGDAFSELAGVPICNKYETPATQRAKQGKQRQKKIKRVNLCFSEHRDTKQFRHQMGVIPAGSTITITEKEHGTSGRYAHVEETVKLPLSWFFIVINFLIHQINRIPGVNIRFLMGKTLTLWAYLMGTRRVIKGEPGVDWHGTDNYRWEFMKDVWPRMHKGEIIYGEIVGYTDTGASIMKGQSTAKLEKPLRKQYGDVMEYKYGCPAGTSAFHVYRIVMTNVDGVETELTWDQVKARSAELGLETVRELAGPFIYLGPNHYVKVDYQLEELAVKTGVLGLYGLQHLVEGLIEGPSLLDPSHIREGVIVRVDGPEGNTYFLKDKSFEFKVLESIIKNNDSYIDTEEVES